MTYICPICKAVVNDKKRHLFGYRIKEGKRIKHIPRCLRQHLRHPKGTIKKGMSARGYSYSQGYSS